MHLEPGNTEGHHNISRRMSLREQVADLGQRIDIPVGHIVLLHGLHPAVLKSALLDLALTDGLHDIERRQRLHALIHQIKHDVIAASNRRINGGGTGDDQIPGIAQPHVGAV